MRCWKVIIGLTVCWAASLGQSLPARAEVGQYGAFRQGEAYYPALVVYERIFGDAKRIGVAVSSAASDDFGQYLVGSRTFDTKIAYRLPELSVSIFVFDAPLNQKIGTNSKSMKSCLLFYKYDTKNSEFICQYGNEYHGSEKYKFQAGDSTSLIQGKGAIYIDAEGSVLGMATRTNGEPPYLVYRTQFLSEIVDAMPLYQTLTSSLELGQIIQSGGIERFLAWNSAYKNLRKAYPGDLVVFSTKKELDTMIDSGAYNRRISLLLKDYATWIGFYKKFNINSLVSIQCTRVFINGTDLGKITYRFDLENNLIFPGYPVDVSENYISWDWVAEGNRIHRTVIDRTAGELGQFSEDGQRELTGECHKIIGAKF